MKDPTKEMQELKESLEIKEEEIKQKQLEYIQKQKKEKEDKLLNKKIVFLFDKQMEIDSKNFETISKVCDESNIYIFSLDNLELNYNNIKVVNIELNDDDFVQDKIHLTKEANNKLLSKIEQEIN
ncbi:MAG: hypothetical protein IJ572_01715 [Bacilli bacterium]|nr:hypothetical protein [Bacilli bacterium]